MAAEPPQTKGSRILDRGLGVEELQRGWGGRLLRGAVMRGDIWGGKGWLGVG
jgi:hypothetical protein